MLTPAKTFLARFSIGTFFECYIHSELFSITSIQIQKQVLFLSMTVPSLFGFPASIGIDVLFFNVERFSNTTIQPLENVSDVTYHPIFWIPSSYYKSSSAGF